MKTEGMRERVYLADVAISSEERLFSAFPYVPPKAWLDKPRQ